MIPDDSRFRSQTIMLGWLILANLTGSLFILAVAGLAVIIAMLDVFDHYRNER